MTDLISLIVFILPSYVANAVPVLLGGGLPLDLGKNFFDGKRLFGDTKTIRGFIAGVAAGTVVGGIISINMSLQFFASSEVQFIASFMLALGTMMGDAFGSFIKRRFSMNSGDPFILDTVLFLVIALMLAYPLTSKEAYQTQNLLYLLILTLIMHPLTNLIANRAGLKKVSW